MKQPKFPTVLNLLFQTSLLALLGTHASHATDYQWIRTDAGAWTANQSNVRLASYGTPTPPVAGPQSGDNLTLTTAGSLTLQNTAGTLDGGLDRAVNNLGATAVGANISSGGNNASTFYTTLTVGGNLSLSGAGTSLTLWNASASNPNGGAMTVAVNGNVSIAAGTSLYLGVIRDTSTPTNVGNSLNGFTANSTESGKGQINIEGKLVLNRLTSNVVLGDVTLGAAGRMTLTGAGATDRFDGTFNKTIQVRSLAGSGTVENSNVIHDLNAATSSTATLQVTTLSATDADFGGTLADGNGTNATLNLLVTGSGRQTLSGSNSYTGTTRVTGGTLLLVSSTNNIASSKSIEVAAGATFDVSAISGGNGFELAMGQRLTGGGTVNGAFTVGSGASLAPGNSPGTLTFNDDLTLALGSTSYFEIDALTASLFDLVQGGAGSQRVTFGGTLELIFQDGFATVGSVKIFDFENYSGTFDSINVSGLASGFYASFDHETGILAVAVPEASTGLLLMAGGLGLTLWRYRRRA